VVASAATRLSIRGLTAMTAGQQAWD
jgi:hypothetical protein